MFYCEDRSSHEREVHIRNMGFSLLYSSSCLLDTSYWQGTGGAWCMSQGEGEDAIYTIRERQEVSSGTWKLFTTVQLSLIHIYSSLGNPPFISSFSCGHKFHNCTSMCN